MVRFTPERQRSVRFLSSFCVSCAPPSLPEAGGVFFIGPAVPILQTRFAYGEAAWPRRSLSVPFSQQKNRATGTNVLGTARFLEPSDRRNSLPQNPGHVKSRRISHSDSALLLHCFRIASRIPIPRRLTARFSHFLKNGAVKKPTFSGTPLQNPKKYAILPSGAGYPVV